MAVTVVTPASERKLTQVATVVARLGLGSTPSYMEQLVLAASNAIERYCGRVFAQQEYSEVLNGNDTDTLALTNAPIIGTPTVACDGSAIVDFEVGDAAKGWLYREVGWARAAWVGWGYDVEQDRLSSRYPLFTVEYTAGYKLPGEDNETLPSDIQEAAIMTVMQWYRRGKRDSDVRSKKVGDLAISYGTVDDNAELYYGIPSMARALLPRRVL